MAALIGAGDVFRNTVVVCVDLSARPLGKNLEEPADVLGDLPRVIVAEFTFKPRLPNFPRLVD